MTVACERALKMNRNRVVDADTDALLEGLGLSREEVARLRSAGVLAGA